LAGAQRCPVRISFSGLALLTVGNGGKGVRPMVPRRARGFGQSRQTWLPSPRWATGGDNGQAMRGSSVVYAPAKAGNAGP
jgi:hypothetical protein